MKNLKLLFLALISVLSLNLFSQTQVYTTPTSGPNVCDGTAALDTTVINTGSILWQGMGMVLGQGTNVVDSLCPGTYTVTFVTNNTPVTLTFTIQAGTFNPCLNFSGMITTTNSVDSTTCDGIMTATALGGTAPYTYLWSNSVPTQSTGSLCPGGYCCYIVDANGCNYTACDTVGVMSSNYGDTLIINNPGNCLNPIGTLDTSIEDCTLNYNAVDSVFISNIIYSQISIDTLYCVWSVIDTNGNTSAYTVYYTPFTTPGCYNFQLIIYCLQKSMNYKTIIVNETTYVDFVGIDELTIKDKELISVVDLMGREVKPEPNKFLIYTYSDGSKEIKYINE